MKSILDEMTREELKQRYPEGVWHLWIPGKMPPFTKGDQIETVTFDRKWRVETSKENRVSMCWEHDPNFIKVIAFRVQIYVDDPIKEMTVAEISEALGYEVKVVK